AAIAPPLLVPPCARLPLNTQSRKFELPPDVTAAQPPASRAVFPRNLLAPKTALLDERYTAPPLPPVAKFVRNRHRVKTGVPVSSHAAPPSGLVFDWNLQSLSLGLEAET